MDKRHALDSSGTLSAAQQIFAAVLEGRRTLCSPAHGLTILVHGEEEATGRSYLMPEGTDGQVHHIYRTPEMEEMRSRRELQINSFIRLRKFSTARGPLVEIQDMGDSEAVLRNKAHFRETAREMIRRGVFPKDDGWNGWLGRYQKALVDAAFALEQQQAKERERRKSRDLGR